MRRRRRRRKGRNCYNPVSAREEIGNPGNPTILYPDSAKKSEEFRASGTDLRNPSEERQGMKHLLIVDGVRDGEKIPRTKKEQRKRDSTESRRKEGRKGGENGGDADSTRESVILV